MPPLCQIPTEYCGRSRLRLRSAREHTQHDKVKKPMGSNYITSRTELYNGNIKQNVLLVLFSKATKKTQKEAHLRVIVSPWPSKQCAPWMA